ncbi:MAG: CDP-glycerol glycerophosphotransferase family protein [Aquabacterium sp.]
MPYSPIESPFEAGVPFSPLSPSDASELSAKVAQLESMQLQMTEAIDALVTGLLDVKALAEQAPTVPAARVAPADPDVQQLAAKLREVESQLAQERIIRHMSHVSRTHAKTPTVVFLGRRQFVDNIKYTWQAFQPIAQAEGIDAWYIPLDAEVEQLVRRQGGQCFPAQQQDWTAEHLSILLRAAVLVSDDQAVTLGDSVASFLAGARHVQLWHGIGLKDVGYANMPALRHFSSQTARVLGSCGPFATFVSTAQSLESEWRRSFSFDRYAAHGYPRNDVLYREPTTHDLENVDVECLAALRTVRQHGRRTYLYAPTFRDAALASWILDIGLDRIAQAVADQGDLLVVNLHPCEQAFQQKIQAVMPHVHFVLQGTDIYPLLRECSALITDYSSILFDFLHVDRPVIQFRPDHQQYITRSRKLHEDKQSDQIGYTVDSAEALIALLQTEQLETVNHASKRTELLHRFYEVRDGQSTQRICSLILDELKLALGSSSPAATHRMTA